MNGEELTSCPLFPLRNGVFKCRFVRDKNNGPSIVYFYFFWFLLDPHFNMVNFQLVIVYVIMFS